MLDDRVEAQRLADKRERIEQSFSKEPTPTKAWDLANIKLEQYFDRNLHQTNGMFCLALFVVFAGLGLIAWTIMYSLAHAQSGSTLLIEIGAGVITQFIGATFMVLYRSTIQQASSNVEILERINAVGMAMQIIADVPKDDPLHNKTKAELANLLLRGSHKIREERPSRPRLKRHEAR
jgi:hypothetical protein